MEPQLLLTQIQIFLAVLLASLIGTVVGSQLFYYFRSCRLVAEEENEDVVFEEFKSKVDEYQHWNKEALPATPPRTKIKPIVIEDTLEAEIDRRRKAHQKPT